jgi:hypothetical protein
LTKEDYFEVIEGRKEISKLRWKNVPSVDKKIYQQEYAVQQLVKIGSPDIEQKFLKILKSENYSANLKRVILRELPKFCSELGIEAILQCIKHREGDIRRMAVASLSKVYIERDLDTIVKEQAMNTLLSVLKDEKNIWSSEEYVFAAEALKDINQKDVNDAFFRLSKLDRSDIGYSELQAILRYRSVNYGR